MKISVAIPTTAMRLRKKRLATMAPGESTLTRRSSFRERWSRSSPFSAFFFSSLLSLMKVALLSYAIRTRGSTTAYRISEIRLPASVSTARNTR